MRLGVFLPNWVGDVVMATPALRALSKLVGPAGSLVGIMRPYVADVLAGNRWLDEQIIYDKPQQRFSLASQGVVRELRAAKLDRIVLLTNSLRTAWMAWRSGAGERVGYVGDMRAWLLTNRLRQSRSSGSESQRPTLDSYLRLAQAVGCADEPPRMELATTAANERAADDVWRQLELPAGERVVVLNPGGAFGVAKHWPAEHFAGLAHRIIAEREMHVLVNCGPAERRVAEEIVARANDSRVVSLAAVEKLPIGLAKACVRRSRLLVTTDSGPRFFGIAFGKPVVTLFGPTDPRMTVTHYDAEACLSLSLECQPCMARECPLGHHRCMRELSVERVYSVVAHFLSKDKILVTEVTSPNTEVTSPNTEVTSPKSSSRIALA